MINAVLTPNPWPLNSSHKTKERAHFVFVLYLIQRWVWSWQDRKHQEGHPVSGPRGLLPQRKKRAQRSCESTLGVLNCYTLTQCCCEPKVLELLVAPAEQAEWMCAHHLITLSFNSWNHQNQSNYRQVPPAPVVVCVCMLTSNTDRTYPQPWT